MKKLFLLAGAAALLATPAFADLAGELSTAQTHAGMAATQADITMAHKHLQHAVNCLVGPNGTGFDAAAGNPAARCRPWRHQRQHQCGAEGQADQHRRLRQDGRGQCRPGRLAKGRQGQPPTRSLPPRSRSFRHVQRTVMKRAAPSGAALLFA